MPDHVIVDETNKDLNSIKTQRSILIEKVFCGNRFSGVLLNNGEFWACGNCADAGKTSLYGPANTRDPEEEEKAAQMQRDEEFKRVLAAEQAM